MYAAMSVSVVSNRKATRGAALVFMPAHSTHARKSPASVSGAGHGRLSVAPDPARIVKRNIGWGPTVRRLASELVACETTALVHSRSAADHSVRLAGDGSAGAPQPADSPKPQAAARRPAESAACGGGSAC